MPLTPLRAPVLATLALVLALGAKEESVATGDEALPRWLVGCWQADGDRYERWVVGDARMLFGAGWAARPRGEEVRAMRLAVADGALTLDVVRSPGATATLRASAAGPRGIAFSDGGVAVAYAPDGPTALAVEATGAGTRTTTRFVRAACDAPPFRGTASAGDELDRLHQADMQAVMRDDADALVGLWTDDIVALAPGAAPRAGRAANEPPLRAGMARSRGVVAPLDYRLSFDQVVLVGDQAIEWGRYAGRARVLADGSEAAYAGQMLRVARRGADGAFRVAVTMFGQ